MSESPRVGQVVRLQLASSFPNPVLTYAVSSVISDIGILLIAFGRSAGPKPAGAAIIDLSWKMPLQLPMRLSLESPKSWGLLTLTSLREQTKKVHLKDTFAGALGK